MRKDGKNSYQAKKEKLLEIKKILTDNLYIWKELGGSIAYIKNIDQIITKIWKIVKDEK